MDITSTSIMLGFVAVSELTVCRQKWMNSVVIALNFFFAIKAAA